MQPLLIPITDRAGNPIPQEGHPDAQFYSVSSTLLAVGFVRIVLGGRGAYVEFSKEHIQMENLHIPEDQMWRLTNDMAYYIEYHSRDAANTKVYHQKRPVDYADYKVGLFYISPGDVVIKIVSP